MVSKLSDAEYRFLEEVWQAEPVKSSRLVEICQEKFGWKKSTTYTVLKRLSERGLFQNNDGEVTSLISRDDFYAKQSKNFVEETFNGSLPAFLSAFASHKKLSKEDISEIKKLIDSYEEV